MDPKRTRGSPTPTCRLRKSKISGSRMESTITSGHAKPDASIVIKKCASSRGAKIHGHRCPHRPDTQNFAGTCADRKVKADKVEEAQSLKPKIKCEERPLKNVARFKYLGSIFSADGSQSFDLRRRIDMAIGRCGALRQVFDGKNIPLSLKLKIYVTAITSIMTYGCEAWNIDERTRAQLNGIVFSVS